VEDIGIMSGLTSLVDLERFTDLAAYYLMNLCTQSQPECRLPDMSFCSTLATTGQLSYSLKFIVRVATLVDPFMLAIQHALLLRKIGKADDRYFLWTDKVR
jgi:hypothetical protein